MKKFEIVNNVSRTIHRLGFKFKKHSPEILVTAGVVGTVVSGVMACKATLKVNDILVDSKEKVDKIHYALENPEALTEAYTEEDSKKDLAITYVQTGFELVKLYAPSVILGAASIGCILTSHKVLRTRNVALAAAYTAVDKGFKEYRSRVIERFGEELDRELRYNIKKKEIEEIAIDENGNEHVVKKTVDVMDSEPSIYARFFDDGCTGWDKNAEMNLFFLLQQQNAANQILKSDGHLFLNEVYDLLGIPRTKAGQMVGWVYDNERGDNYVDFGIYDVHNKKAREFVNGYERTILLDFNVDGNILDLIEG